MQSLTQTISDFEHALSSFADYLELWANYDVKAEYRQSYSMEFIAFMLLKSRGELERHTNALVECGGVESQSLIDTKNELERIFSEEVVDVNGDEIRDILLKTLDCEALIPDVNEYLGLHDHYASESQDRMRNAGLIEIGCDLILKRDELQLVIDGIRVLMSDRRATASVNRAWEEKIAQLAGIDSTIKQHAPAFEPLAQFIANFRNGLGSSVLDRERYWWWFLDEQMVAQPPAIKSALSRHETKKIVREMAELANATGSNGGDWQQASRLLQIGQLAYRRLVSDLYTSHRDALAKFAHGALNQALVLLGDYANSPQYAQACFSLSLVCRYIASRNEDMLAAEKSLSLLKMASSRLSSEDLASLGLGTLSERQAKALIEDLRERAERARETPGLIATEAAVPVLDRGNMLAWLHSTYGVKPRSKKGLWGRIEALLQKGLPVPQRFMRPRLAVGMGGGEPVRDEEEGEELAELRPGIRGKLYWPLPDRRPLVWLYLSIEERDKLGLVPDKPVQIVLWANYPPPATPEGLEWADWIADGRQYMAKIEADERRLEIPITKPCRSVNEQQKQIIRKWISYNLVIELHR